jgi:cold shock CspA family protein
MAVDPPRLGTVTAFDEDAGLGTIETEGGDSLPFHCTRISDGSRTIAVGTKVACTVGPGLPGRWEATSVVKLA